MSFNSKSEIFSWPASFRLRQSFARGRLSRRVAVTIAPIASRTRRLKHKRHDITGVVRLHGDRVVVTGALQHFRLRARGSKYQPTVSLHPLARPFAPRRPRARVDASSRDARCIKITRARSTTLPRARPPSPHDERTTRLARAPRIDDEDPRARRIVSTPPRRANREPRSRDATRSKKKNTFISLSRAPCS